VTKEFISLNKEATIHLWTERVSTCQASNLTVKQWCQQNNIPCSSYYHWQKKLFDTAVASSQVPVPQFAEVPVSATSFIPQSSAPDVIASLEIDGITIRLYSNANANVIAAICKGLKCYTNVATVVANKI